MRWGLEGWLTLLWRQVAQALHARGLKLSFLRSGSLKSMCLLGSGVRLPLESAVRASG